MIRFTAPNTWYQNNFNLTRRSSTLAMGERLLLTYTNFLNFYPLFYIPPATWIYVIDFKRCKNSFRSYQVHPQGSLNFHLLPTPSPNDGDISVLYLTQFHCVMNLNELVHENLWLTWGFERLLNEFWVSRYFSKMLNPCKRQVWGERHVTINVLTQASKRNFV